ncbi:hypothetical protein Ndes2526B_g03100 [Nannochloris sp. 'desiccata']|nr:hypothetical protein KSW81_006661 [Chlorella desiccata (nom. nud.)]
MLIPIHPADGASPAVWAMIELQGKLERNGENKDTVGFDVGTLTTSSTGTLHLTIGYHQCEGKIQTLKKPLAVLSKTDGADPATGEPTQEYKVVGVVREKYLFKARPRALISKPK